MNQIDERNIDPIEEINRIAHNFLDLSLWGFKVSYHSSTLGKLIFDSEWCRLSFSWDGWDYLGGNNISIRYGRLHASNEKNLIVWNGDECRCWHDFDHPIHFLDGHLPADAVKMFYSHPITSPFYEEKIRKEFHRRQPEWLARMHAAVWQHYGKRFFELFDVRRPDLWDQYRQFLKEFYDIKGRSSAIKPPLDKVC